MARNVPTGRKEHFYKGHLTDNNGVEYNIQRVGGTVFADAHTPNTESLSSANFEYDPSTGAHEIVPGTLDIHPDHANLEVGRTMRRMVNAKYKGAK